MTEPSQADKHYEEAAFLDLMNRLLAKHILVVNGESIHGYSTEQMGMAFKAGLNAAAKAQRPSLATTGTPLLWNVHCMWQQTTTDKQYADEWEAQWRELLAAIDQHLVRVGYPNAAEQAGRSEPALSGRTGENGKSVLPDGDAAGQSSGGLSFAPSQTRRSPSPSSVPPCARPKPPGRRT